MYLVPNDGAFGIRVHMLNGLALSRKPTKGVLGGGLGKSNKRLDISNGGLM
jgi:hypothetical protein